MKPWLERLVYCSTWVVSLSAQASEMTFEWDWMLSAETVQQRETVFSPMTDNEHTESFNGLLDVQIGYQNW
ncbi:MAG: hypothetical protein GY920_18065, partial [Aliivibrio sp.]|nr:hypothetical protein [Aliivibrio sp.]